MTKQKHILIMAGGTGGHIYPALTLAKALEQHGHKIFWLGGSHGLEHRLVTDYPLYSLAIKGLRGATVWQGVFAPIRLLIALFQAIKIIRHIKPHLVIGLGGYASGPGGLAAWLLRKPLIIHEQNAIAGLTNKLLARLAKKVLQAFPNAFKKNISAITVGNPIREDIIHIPAPNDRLHDINNRRLRLLILGGSQGAAFLNQKVVECMHALSEEERPDVWHQTGQQQFDKTHARYATILPNAKVTAYIDNVADAYRWADLIICRSGALTVSEVAAAGIASIFIPFPSAVDNHQFYNAQYLVNADAATVIVQSSCQTDTLTSLWRNYLANRQQLVHLANAARGQAKADACNQIITICQTWLQ